MFAGSCSIVDTEYILPSVISFGSSELSTGGRGSGGFGSAMFRKCSDAAVALQEVEEGLCGLFK